MAILSPDEIQSRIHPTLLLDRSTYINTKNKARFVDQEYGDIWKLVSDVLKQKNFIHPTRRKEINKIQQLEKIKKSLPSNITIDESTFTSITHKATFIHKDHGKWETLPLNVIDGRSTKPRQFITLDFVKKNLPDFITIKEDTFRGSNIPAVFIDEIYGSWKAKPWRVLNGSVHKKRSSLVCGKIKIRDLESIKEKLPSFVTIKEETYKGVHKSAVFIDEKYGEFTSLVKNVIYNGLSHKRRNRSRSKAEDEIAKFLESYVSLIQNYRPIKNLELDLYVPDKKTGIEYHGLYWHSSQYKKRQAHADKLHVFKNKGIALLQIYSDEWEFKQPIVKSIIKAKLGVSANKYQARKLEIKEVPSQEAQDFLKENHLMGEYRSAKHLGLYAQETLISLLSYKKHRGGIDIARFCNKLDTSVAGGLSRLLKEVERREQPPFIQSWVDLRYGSGESLTKLGFKHLRTTLGWKWTDGVNTYNRLKCRANMDSRRLTEKQHAQELGWVKIYDAGQALFVKNLQ